MNYFDIKSAEWDNNPIRTERALKTFEIIKKTIPINNNFNCMEYGCGTGILSFYFQAFVKSITLIDSSKGMLEVLNKKINDKNIKNMKSYNIDILKDNPLNEKFDLIYTILALHHIKDTNNIINKFYAMLNKNGYLCIADLIKEDGSFHSHHKDFDGHSGFNTDELEVCLKETKFNIIYNKIYYEIKKEVSGVNKKYPLFLIICKK